ncbi:MAG: ATPase, T2SS/T4P/T4SS family, partial [Lachnospirales bacterium]
NIDFKNVSEIRIRLGLPIYIFKNKREIKIDYLPTKEDISETFSRMCHFSPFAYIESIKRGFITIGSGCRVGICGTVIDNSNIRDITSLNIRIARAYENCSKIIADLTGGNILISSPPAFGKTTMLRDLIRIKSNSGLNIGVVDERGEICGEVFDLGKRSDVIKYCSKDRGMLMLLRSMAPDVIAVDEIGGNEDIKACEKISNCGVNIIATIHAKNISEVKNRLGQAYNIFDYVVILGKVGKIDKIYKGADIIWQQNF